MSGGHSHSRLRLASSQAVCDHPRICEEPTLPSRRTRCCPQSLSALWPHSTVCGLCDHSPNISMARGVARVHREGTLLSKGLLQAWIAFPSMLFVDAFSVTRCIQPLRPAFLCRVGLAPKHPGGQPPPTFHCGPLGARRVPRIHRHGVPNLAGQQGSVGLSADSHGDGARWIPEISQMSLN